MDTPWLAAGKFIDESKVFLSYREFRSSGKAVILQPASGAVDLGVVTLAEIQVDNCAGCVDLL